MSAAKDGAKELAAAKYPEIRLLLVSRATNADPQRDLPARWKVCNPKTVAEEGWGGFSAVGYFFGRELHRELKVPIGLIESSWGGTRIEPWTPLCGFKGIASLQPNMVWWESMWRESLQTYPDRLRQTETLVAAAHKALAEGKQPPTIPAVENMRASGGSATASR